MQASVRLGTIWSNIITTANAGKRLGFAGKSRIGLSHRPGVAEFHRSLRREIASTTAERGVVSDSALPFAAGILWEQAFGGQRKQLPRVWSLPNNAVNLGASIRGDARIGRHGQNI